MTLSISISAETEAKLKAKAAVEGVDLPTYAARVLEQLACRPTLDELLAPLRAEVEASGITEAQLTNLLEEAKHEQRDQRHSRKAS